MIQTFKDYINKIDIKSDNIDSSVNTNKDLSDREKINKIIKHKFSKDLKINEFLI